MIYEVVVEGEVREIYEVDASSAAEAKIVFENGDAGQPVVSEVIGASVAEVKEPS